MPVTDPRGLFVRELSDVLAAERRIFDMLPELVQQANDAELRQALERHRGETEDHVKNLEQAFHRLGEEPVTDFCAALAGLGREHKETIHEVTPDLHDQVVVHSASATEHYEISAYEGLITMAAAMGERDVVQLLEENLHEEEAMLEDGKRIAHRLAEQAAAAQSERERSFVDRLLPGR
jgi:ferritin-like metal-binding protein YciE